MTEPVTVERDEHVLLIGVNRAAKRNAFDLAAIDVLARAYEMLGTDDELRAGVLFAHGDHFSAGLDLAEVGPAVAGHGPGVLRGSHRFDPFGVWGDPVPKPVVRAVNGIAFTLSIELALAADIVVAAAATARTRRANVWPRCCPASCAARTPPKGSAASSNGARHISPATDQPDTRRHSAGSGAALHMVRGDCRGCNRIAIRQRRGALDNHTLTVMGYIPLRLSVITIPNKNSTRRQVGRQI